MVFEWLKSQSKIMSDPRTTVVVVAGKSIGAFAERMAAAFQEVNFELFDTTPDTVDASAGRLRRIFLLYGVLWILDDEACIALLRQFVPLLLHPSRPILLVCDLVSPEKGQFEPHVELAFRRRDVTLMTMHNARQRTAKQWLQLVGEADPRFQVSPDFSIAGPWFIGRSYMFVVNHENRLHTQKGISHIAVVECGKFEFLNGSGSPTRLLWVLEPSPEKLYFTSVHAIDDLIYNFVYSCCVF